MNIPISVNLILVILTVATSVIAFSNRNIYHSLKFNPTYIRSGEWWRFFSGALVHADILHLAFNMLALWSIGGVVEMFFQEVIGNPIYGSLAYVAFYIVAVPMSSLYSYERHKNDSWYNAVGASGAISAVVFSFVLFAPGQTISFFFIPMPAWIFGILFLVFSWVMARRGNSNIGHDAHFFGAVFGIIVTLIIYPSSAKNFLDQILNFF